jgi:carboxypeptidase C (cathepsin A)
MNKKLYSGSPCLLAAVLFTFISFSVKGADGLSFNVQDTVKKSSSNIPKAEQAVTQHKITIGGVSMPYTATAGTLIIRNTKDLPYASIGYTAYIRSDISDPSHRPITFAYNGGPGSCSIWLHMGALGPRRIVTNDTAYIPPPPFNIIDNAYSLLDKTDLVMIDPVGTGFSHAVGESKDKDFWSVDSDIESIAWFIRQYITENSRWNSPKYILGESYGTTRSAGIVDYLQSKEYMSFNGVILVSMATDLELIFDDIPGYHWPSVFELPTYTAVAWYHKILPDPPVELAPLLNEVRTFAFQEYSNAIDKGNNLPESERKAIIDKLHRYTGLSVEYLESADMRVIEPQFANELMRDRRKTVGSLDARFLGVNFDPLGKNIEYDPMDAAITPAFAAAFLDYLHRDLNFGQGKTYVLDADVWKIWDYRHKIADAWIAQPMVNTGLDLAHAMGFNPSLKVMVLQGIYDMGSPFLATEYMVSHLNLHSDLRSHIEIKYYDAGHMMYIHEPSLKKFKNDIANFIDGTSRQ